MEKISIIIPVYNVEDYLGKCIDSVINQTYRNLEIILVDDGSPDNSGAICDDYAERDERIIVIHKENGGLSEARNAGISIATGDYIGFVDSDDWLEAEMYEKLLNALLAYDADISACCIKKIYNNKEVLQNFKRDRLYSRRKAQYELIQNNDFENFAWNKLYKKELFKEIRFPVGRIFEDMLCIPHIVEKANKIIHINYLGYNYIRHDDSILSNWPLKTQVEFTHAQQDRIEYLMPIYPEFSKFLFKKYINSIIDLKKKVINVDYDSFKKDYKVIKTNLSTFYFKNKKEILSYSKINNQRQLMYFLLFIHPLLFRRALSVYRKIKR